MNGNKEYWMQEAYRHLVLALNKKKKKEITQEITSAMECLNLYNQRIKDEDINDKLRF